ncbi:uncharacterized protein [Miscanthus floridulus]|uniref:uncharacterized protein isoform X2 n=1 Tax=Miscanthus floridulus TaxID=154761 RepID=UPI0034589DC6
MLVSAAVVLADCSQFQRGYSFSVDKKNSLLKAKGTAIEGQIPLKWILLFKPRLKEHSVYYIRKQRRHRQQQHQPLCYHLSDIDQDTEGRTTPRQDLSSTRG